VDLVWQAIRDAVELIDWADADLMRIVWLSLIVLGAAAVPAVNGR
jgi:ABC-type tungstate transport system substrate-binding protein